MSAVAGFAVLIFTLLGGAEIAHAKKCAEIYVGDQAWVAMKELRPTQMAVGMGEVMHRAEKIDQMDDEELDSYLREKKLRVVIGPDGYCYVVDGHHMWTAASEKTKVWDLDELRVQCIADYSRMKDPEVFWKQMQSKNWAWFYDEDGKPVQWKSLPKSPAGLKDDPFRTLAWMVQKGGGYRETKTPYAEFRWANAYRKEISKKPKTKKEWEAALDKAWKFSRSSDAKDLPGWSGGSGGPSVRCNLKELMETLLSR